VSVETFFQEHVFPSVGETVAEFPLHLVLQTCCGAPRGLDALSRSHMGLQPQLQNWLARPVPFARALNDPKWLRPSPLHCHCHCASCRVSLHRFRTCNRLLTLLEEPKVCCCEVTTSPQCRG
jgi:hypothetical protein